MTIATAPLFTKDPTAVLDYEFDWADWLETGETISVATVTADAGINVDSHPNTTTTVTAWLSGGTLDARYQVRCHITTSGGRQDTRTLLVDVVDR